MFPRFLQLRKAFGSESAESTVENRATSCAEERSKIASSTPVLPVLFLPAIRFTRFNCGKFNSLNFLKFWILSVLSMNESFSFPAALPPETDSPDHQPPVAPDQRQTELRRTVLATDGTRNEHEKRRGGVLAGRASVLARP